MTVAAGMMVKDEADVIGHTIDHLLGQGVTRIYVLDNGSTDGTPEILADKAATAPVVIETDTLVGYYQSAKMTGLLARATADGFDWFLPVDADELWTASSDSSVRLMFSRLADEVGTVTAALFDHVATSLDDPAETNPFRRLTWFRPAPAKLPKVAVRCRYGVTITQGNHAVQGDMLAQVDGLVVHHYPYRSAEQFVRKAVNGAAAYAAAPDLDPSMGVHWRLYGSMIETHGTEAAEAWFREHFYIAGDPIKAGLVNGAT